MPQPTHAQTPTVQISVINESTVLADADVVPVVAALQKQVTNDFRPVWGTDAELTIVPKGTQPPSGTWWLVMLDDSDQANALGYHDLTTEGLPIGKVFAASDLKAGTSWTVTASHELLEMLGDPNINLTVFVQNTNTAGTLYAYEVCDACEDDSLGYQVDNILLSDFVYPAWFESFRTEGSTQFDRMNKITTPFQLLVNGYIGVFNVSSGSGWQQQTPGQTSNQRPASGRSRHAPRTPRHSSRTVDQQPAAAQDRGQCTEVSPDPANHSEAARSSLKVSSGCPALACPARKIARGFFCDKGRQGPGCSDCLARHLTLRHQKV